MKIHISGTLHCVVVCVILQDSNDRAILILRGNQTFQFFEMSDTTHPTTQSSIPEECRIQIKFTFDIKINSRLTLEIYACLGFYEVSNGSFVTKFRDNLSFSSSSSPRRWSADPCLTKLLNLYQATLHWSPEGNPQGNNLADSLKCK